MINKDERLINDIKENDYNTLMFVLKLTFREWLDLLTGKRNFQDLSFYYKVNGEINFNLIKFSQSQIRQSHFLFFYFNQIQSMFIYLKNFIFLHIEYSIKILVF